MEGADESTELWRYPIRTKYVGDWTERNIQREMMNKIKEVIKRKWELLRYNKSSWISCPAHFTEDHLAEDFTTFWCANISLITRGHCGCNIEAINFYNKTQDWLECIGLTLNRQFHFLVFSSFLVSPWMTSLIFFQPKPMVRCSFEPRVAPMRQLIGRPHILRPLKYLIFLASIRCCNQIRE